LFGTVDFRGQAAPPLRERCKTAERRRCPLSQLALATWSRGQAGRGRPSDWSTNRSGGECTDRTVLQRFSAPSPARQEGCKRIATFPPRDLSRKRAGEAQSSRVIPQFCMGLLRERVA